MNTHEELYQLVASLDATEQRYFKIFLNKSKRKTKSNIEILFDIIKKHKEFDETQIQLSIQKSKIAKNYNYVKHQLINQIVDFLGVHHRNNHVLLTLDNYWGQLFILTNKKQYKLALKITSKALEVSVKHNLVSYIHKFYLARLNILIKEQNVDYDLYNETLINIRKASKISIAHMNSDLLYKEICQKLLTGQLRDVEQAKESLKSIENDPFFKDESLAISFDSKSYLYATKVIYHEALKEFDQCIHYYELIFQLYEENPSQLEVQLDNYIIDFSDYITILSKQKKIEKASAKLADFKQLPKRFSEQFSPPISNLFTKLKLSITLHHHVYAQQYTAAYDFIQSNEFSKLEKYFSSTDEYTKNRFYKLYMHLSFALGKYDNYISSYDTYVTEFTMNQFKVSHFFSKLFYCLCLFESEEFGLLSSQFDALYYLKRRDEFDNDYYLALTQVARKLTQNPINEDLASTCNKALISIQNFDQSIKPNIHFVELFEYWLISKAEQMSLLAAFDKYEQPLIHV